ncbi:MAG: hypothetical protein IBX69_04385 [Anaerolineales bacterium]|nr:hypothetical protein [Anaerolineales bacterium]
MVTDSFYRLPGWAANLIAAVPVYPIWTAWFGHLLLANRLNPLTEWTS